MKIAIASGKGGTGKTFVSTNLFWTAQHFGIPTTLIDCDAEEPNVREFLDGEEQLVEHVYQNVPHIDPEKCTFCGKCAEYCNYNAILFLPENRFIKVLSDLCHDCGACSYACEYEAVIEQKKQIGTVKIFDFDGFSHIIESCSEVGVYSPVSVIKKAIKEADPQHLILLDTPPGISCPFVATVEQADFIILVAEPTPFGLHDLKLSVSTLRQLQKPFGVIVNKSGLGNRAVYQWLDENKIPLLLEIPFDKDIARTYSEGKILSQENEAYRKIFQQVLNIMMHTHWS
jgi:MinD superfamily P-loop ATPase